MIKRLLRPLFRFRLRLPPRLQHQKLPQLPPRLQHQKLPQLPHQQHPSPHQAQSRQPQLPHLEALYRQTARSVVGKSLVPLSMPWGGSFTLSVSRAASVAYQLRRCIPSSVHVCDANVTPTCSWIWSVSELQKPSANAELAKVSCRLWHCVKSRPVLSAFPQILILVNEDWTISACTGPNLWLHCCLVWCGVVASFAAVTRAGGFCYC